jgi:hypothetical protein
VPGKENDLLSLLVSKINHFMSDRAANEAKADDILQQWMQECLAAAGNDNEKTTTDYSTQPEIHSACPDRVFVPFQNNAGRPPS